MVSAVVQKLRIVQTLRWLRLRLLVNSDRGGCRDAVLQNVTQSHNNHDDDQRGLEFFHSLGWHLLFSDRLPALDLSDLQVHKQRKKENEDQRNSQPLPSEA